MAQINNVRIGLTRATLRPAKWVSTFMARNVKRVMANIPETNDGRLHYENVDRFYYPEVVFTFNFSTPAEFAAAVQIINADAFVAQYHCPEINLLVTRLFRMDSHSVDLFLNAAGRYHGAINYQFQARSPIGYLNYAELRATASVDSNVP